MLAAVWMTSPSPPGEVAERFWLQWNGFTNYERALERRLPPPGN